MNQTFPSSVSSWLCCALSVVILTLASPAEAQEKLPRTITVTGRGVEMVPTGIAQVRLGVEVQGKTAAQVQQEVARRSSAVVELLKSRNVEKLETTGISLNPTYSYENNVQRLTGYVATNIVSFRIETEKSGTLLDEAVSAGATRIDGVSFVAPDEVVAAAQKQALKEATQDAQLQADAVLSSLNLTRKEVVSIQVNGTVAPVPPFIPRAAAPPAGDIAIQTAVIGGEQQVEASVTLQISY